MVAPIKRKVTNVTGVTLALPFTRTYPLQYEACPDVKVTCMYLWMQTQPLIDRTFPSRHASLQPQTAMDTSPATHR